MSKTHNVRPLGELVKREATFDTSSVNADKRTCELSFSSEMPVQRGDYMEVLSHDPADVDLSRLNDAHPLLLNHDPERQIGVVEQASIGADKRGHAVVRFSKSSLGEEIWRDVQDGIRRLVSVGYRRTKELASEVRDGVESVRFAWQPYEVSLVSVPADSSVGVGRAEQTETKSKEIKIMSDVKIEVMPTRDFQKENGEIIAIAKNLGNKVEGIRDLADKAIQEGWTVDAFRAQALNKLPESRPVTPLSGVSQRDWKKYSITRAISMQLPGQKRDGIENELSEELTRIAGNGMKPEGVLIPDEAFSRSLIAGTPTLGGMVVQTSVMADEFIEILRNKSQVLNLGARVLNLPGPVTIPRQNGAGTVNWAGETVASTLTAINFQNLTLTPQAITAFHQYSKQLLQTANPSIDALVRDDITQTIALAIDLAALHGSGSGQPTGIINTSGIGSVLAATNGIQLSTYAATNYPALVSLESLVAASNADVGSMAYLMRPGHRGALKGVQRFSSTDSPVFSPDGMVNGYKAAVSNQLLTNLTTGTATTISSAIFFGNWNELLIASFGSTDLVIDPYTAGANGVVRLYARRWCDIGVRHAASFSVLGGVLTT